MNLKKLLAVGAIFALLVTASLAQPGGGRRMGMFGGMGGGMMNSSMMLQRDDVKAELKLTDEQVTKLAELRDKMRSDMRSAFQEAQGDREAMQKIFQKMGEKTTKEVNAILTPDQQKRLKELGIQRAGNSAILNEEVQKDLALTDDQIAKVKELQKKQMQAMQAIGEKMRNQEISMDEARPLFEKNQKIMGDELAKILTSAQKDKLKTLGGAPFKFTEDAPAGGN